MNVSNYRIRISKSEINIRKYSNLLRISPYCIHNHHIHTPGRQFPQKRRALPPVMGDISHSLPDDLLPSSPTTAVIIVDHGSRRTESNLMLNEFVQLYKQITKRSIVEVAHMEIAQPSIALAIKECRDQGALSIVIAPYFLSKGRHIQDDIPALVKEASELYPDVTLSIAEPIGIDPLMVQLIENRVQSSVSTITTATAAAATKTETKTAASRTSQKNHCGH
jgi:sirohydrochlorin ferrochelatase